MSKPSADRNLLFGILALQMDFITRDQLVAAMKACVSDKRHWSAKKTEVTVPRLFPL